MSLIQASELRKSFGIQDVIQDVSLVVPRQARIALVGPNGVGKSTILRMLAGLDSPDHGEINWAKNLQIGFLPQEAIFSHEVDTENTVWAHCELAFKELRALEAKLAELERAMADPREVEQALRLYGPLQERFEREGGYSYEARIQQVLHGLGFSQSEFDVPLERLSGGEGTRAQLAHLLLLDPDLLILDEPTNHLDIQAIEWLENYMRDWPGAVLIVSHDRFFVDRVIETVWDLRAEGLEVYSGNYTAYLQQRAEREAFLRKRYEAQQKHVQKEEEYIRRNIAGQNTRQAQGRRKRLKRFLEDEALELPRRQPTAGIQFSSPERAGDLVLRTYDLEIGHHDAEHPLFRVPDLVLKRSGRVALIGPNGAGKTTFLKTLLGDIAPKSGIVDLGANLHVGYFEQAHAGLDPERRVLDVVLAAEPHLKEGEARSYLAQFHLTGDDVFKRVGMLSSGERAKIALACLTLEGANLLLLDEPTNHLDIPAQEALEEALRTFPGTILLVSHDRYLIEALAEQVWAISPDEGSLEVIEGGYSDYLSSRQDQAEKKSEAPPRASQREEPEARKAVDLGKLETRIARLEEELELVSRDLESFQGDVEMVIRLGERYAKVEAELDEALSIWEREAEAKLDA